MKTKKWLDIEEALSEIWSCRENKERKQTVVREKLVQAVSKDVFEELIKEGLTKISGENIELTQEGEKVARDVIRRQRLAERLLVDVLEVKSAEMDATACEFEHIISQDVADAICTLLGHPKACPHGSAIPGGPCCAKAEAKIESIVVPLTNFSVGEKGKVAYVVTSDHPHLHKLLSLGIIPGTEIQLHQKAPSYVIKVEQTQIALDKDVADHIYVRKA